MKLQKTVEIWLLKKWRYPPIELVQFDTGAQLVFVIKDFKFPNGTTATLFVQKPSGKFVYQETDITVINNTVTIDLENQAITEHGKDIPFQIQFKNGADRITAFVGTFYVEKSLADAGATESKTVIAAFEEKTAEQIAAIEAAADEHIETIRNMLSASRISYVDLLASAWVGTTHPYSQVVAIDGITENSQVDLTPSVEQLAIFYDKEMMLVAENEDGVVTVYAIGQKPTNDYTIQVTITEVAV